MKFLHKTISDQSELSFCAVLDTPQASSTSVLLVRQKEAIQATIKKEKDGSPDVDVKVKYVLETPLLWGYAKEKYMLGFTKTCKFIVTKMSDDCKVFEPVAQIPVLQDITSLCSFSVSWNEDYICATSKSNWCLVVNVQDPESPACDVFVIDNGVIIDGTSGESDDTFVLLTMDTEGNRTCVEFSATSMQCVSVNEVDRDIIRLIPSADSSAKQITEMKEKEIAGMELPGKIIAVSEKKNNIVTCFCEGNLMVSISIKKKCMMIVENAPDLTNIVTLPNGQLMAWSCNSDVVVFTLPEVKKQKLKWKGLKAEQVTSITKIDRMVSIGDTMYLTMGDTIKEVTRQSEIDASEVGEIEEGEHLLSCGEDQIIITSESSSRTMKQTSTKITDDEMSLDGFIRSKKLYQITRNGIMCNGKQEVKFDSPVIMAVSEYEGAQVVVLTESYELRVYRKATQCYAKNSFDLPDDVEITSIDMCDGMYAVSMWNTQLCTGRVCLYTVNLDEIGEAIPVPTYVTKVMFVNDGNELYIAGKNGTVLCAGVEKERGFNGQSFYVFIGRGDILIEPLEKSGIAIVCEGKLYLYNETLLPTGISGVSSICPLGSSSNEDSSLCYVRDNKIFEIDPDLFDDFYDVTETDEKTIRDAVYMPSSTLLVHDQELQMIKDGESSAMAIDNIKAVTAREKLNGDANIPAISHDNTLTYIKYHAAEKSFNVVCQHKLDVDLSLIRPYQNLFLCLIDGVIRTCKVQKDQVKWYKAEASFDTPVTTFEVLGDFVWIVLGDNKVAVLTQDRKNDIFRICAHTSYHRTISMIRPVDDLTAIICFEDHDFTICEMPNSAAHGYTKLSKFIPTLQTKLTCKLGGTVVSAVVSHNKIIYATKNGIIGSFIPISSARDFRDLANLQDEIRTRYESKNALSKRSRHALASSPDIVDYDLISAYRQTEDEDESIPFFALATLSVLLV